MVPHGPVAVTVARSIPFSLATRLAAGTTLRATFGVSGSGGVSKSPSRRSSAVVATYAMGSPTGMTSSGRATRRISVPSTFDSTSMSTLSVLTSQTTSPARTSSPSALCQVTYTPSVMVIDIFGMTSAVCFTICGPARSPRRRCLRPAAPRHVPVVARTGSARPARTGGRSARAGGRTRATRRPPPRPPP